MEQCPDVFFIEAKPGVSGREQPCDVAMLNHHALGQAGGAGGVDHIGQVRGAHRDLRIAHGLVPQIRIVEIDNRYLHRRQGFLYRMLAEQRHRGAVAKGVGQAFARVSRVQRHITGAGLEDPQQADDHCRTTFDTDGDPVIRAYTEGQQPMGNLVGAGVEFAVAQAFILVHQRHGLRPLGGAGFELLVNGAVFGEVLRLGIPRLQLRGFAGIEQRERANRQLCIRQPLVQHVLQALGHGLDLARLEIRLVVDVVQPGLSIVGVGPQMDRQRCLFVIVRTLHRAGARRSEAQQGIMLLVGEGQVEQLRTLGTAQLQQAVEIADRETLVAVILLDRPTDALDQFGKRQIGTELQAHRTDLGKQPQGLLEAGVGAVEDRQANHQLIALLGPGEVDVQHGQQDMETRGLQLPGQLVDTVLQVPGKTAGEVAAAARTFSLGLAIAREQQPLGDIAVLFQPVGLVANETRRLAIIAVVVNKIDIGRRRQIRRALIVQGVVDLAEGRKEFVDAPTVEHDMVGVDHKVETLRFELEQMQPEQRAAIEFEGPFELTLHPAHSGPTRVRLPLQVQRRDPHRQRVGEGLQRHTLFVTLVEQDHAQGIVLVDQQVHGLLEHLGIEVPFYLQIAPDVVQRRVALGHLVQPDIALGSGQGKCHTFLLAKGQPRHAQKAATAGN